MQKNDFLFMRPLWRRIALLLVCLTWTALEWWGGSNIWSGLATIVSFYVIWRYFLNFQPGTGANDLET